MGQKHLKAVWAEKYIDTAEVVQNQELDDAVSIVLKFRESAREREGLLQGIAVRARELEIRSAPRETDRPDAIAGWVSAELRLRDYLEHRDFVRMVYRFKGMIKTPDEINVDLLDFYNQALEAGVAGVPDQYTETSWKIEWARKVTDGELPVIKRL